MLLTLGSLSPPESLCIIIGGQIIGTECDVLRLKDAQDIFYAAGDQRTRNREVRRSLIDPPWRCRRAGCDAIVVKNSWMGGDTIVNSDGSGWWYLDKAQTRSAPKPCDLYY